MSVTFQSGESFVPRMFLQVYWIWPRVKLTVFIAVKLCCVLCLWLKQSWKHAYVWAIAQQCLHRIKAASLSHSAHTPIPASRHKSGRGQSWDSWPCIIHNIMSLNKTGQRKRLRYGLFSKLFIRALYQPCLWALVSGCLSIFFTLLIFLHYLLHFIILTFFFFFTY